MSTKKNKPTRETTVPDKTRVRMFCLPFMWMAA